MSGASELRTPLVLARLNEIGHIPHPNERPQRCRAIIFNPEGTKVLGITRKRLGREAYTVYPGGGVEDKDKTAVAAIRRELKEELNLSQDDVLLTGRILRFKDQVGGDQFYYLGLAANEFTGLAIHGPEAKNDHTVYGTYDPRWILVSDLDTANFQPAEVTRIIRDNG